MVADTDEDKLYCQHELRAFDAAYDALAASPQPQPVQPSEQYLCKAWGETDLPAAAIVSGLDGVRAFLVEQWLGDAEHEHDDGTKALPEAMADMQTYWVTEGECWSAEFEIGGVSVQKVFHAAPKTFAQAKPEQAAQQWMPIETAPTGATGYAWMMLAWGPEQDKSTGVGMRDGEKFYASATFYCLGRDKQYEFREIEVRPTHWMPLPAAPQPKD